jgi:ABC-type glutathione transport system ATPase component
MLLDIQYLTVTVEGQERPIILRGNLTVNRGEVVAVVGGSGSGKTTLGLAVLRLLDPGLKVSFGEIFWKGQDLLGCSEKEMRAIRGAQIAMVFQEPLNAFDPLFCVRDQVDEVLCAHTRLTRRQRQEKIACRC